MSATDQSDDEQRFRDLAHEILVAGLDCNPTILRLLHELAQKPAWEEKLAHNIRKLIRECKNHDARERMNPLHPVPKPHHFSDIDITLGNIQTVSGRRLRDTSNRAGLRIEQMHHLLLVGSTQAGKTLLMISMILDFIIACMRKARSFGVFVFEYAKHDFRLFIALLKANPCDRRGD